MRRTLVVVLALALVSVPVAEAKRRARRAKAPAEPAAQAGDQAIYVPKYEDPVLREMEERQKEEEEKAEEATKEIREGQKARKDAEKKEAKTLRFDMSKLVKPAGPSAFKSSFHFPPVAQFRTSTCWSFSATSFFESEVHRLTGSRIKLSEMYTVYWEYVEKMRRFVRERGDSAIAEGSETNALRRLWKEHGIVPEAAYAGVLADDGRHDHTRLFRRLDNLKSWVREHDDWDEDLVVALTRAILDREMGRPPESFRYLDSEYTPQEFLAKALRVNPDDYVDVMSTLSEPFWVEAEFKAPDNWWHDASYVNVPLADWYGAFKRAVENGYTVAIGGDVSEPGLNGFEDAAVVPSFDVPQAAIDQSSRELRISNGTTEDDHGIHVVGIASAGGHDWFLVKDSGRSSRWGKHEGYYFYRDDYVRLKMLSYMVHRDAVSDLMARLHAAAASEGADRVRGR